mgnify:FL=1
MQYLYDQITLAPFIYVDDHADSTSPSLRAPSPHAQLGQSLGPSASSSSFVSTSGSMTGQTFLSAAATSKGKVDPYQLIASGQTRRFRVDVESMVPPRSPFSFTGTTAFFVSRIGFRSGHLYSLCPRARSQDTSHLHSLFAHAPVLQITNRSRAGSRSQGVGSPPMSANADAVETESPNPSVFGSPLLPTMSNSTFVDPPKKKDRPPISSLKITKVGLLSRKEDLVEGGRKAPSRKWRGWSVVLTGSQLLFFVRSRGKPAFNFALADMYPLSAEGSAFCVLAAECAGSRSGCGATAARRPRARLFVPWFLQTRCRAFAGSFCGHF